MAEWTIDSVEIASGFLAGLTVSFPASLVCIIGPRGSGKSTLAEAIRYALLGLPAGPKSRLEMLKANLSNSVVTVKTKSGEPNNPSYTIRRLYGQGAQVNTGDGRLLSNIDLERGTFLPVDAYGSADIESISDESLGSRRRELLDDLRADDLQNVGVTVSALRRELEANADSIRLVSRKLMDINEQIEELGEARIAAESMSGLYVQGEAPEYTALSQQREREETETQLIESAARLNAEVMSGTESVTKMVGRLAKLSLAVPGSRHQPHIEAVQSVLRQHISYFLDSISEAQNQIEAVKCRLQELAVELKQFHSETQSAFLEQLELNQQAAARLTAVREAQKKVELLERLELKRDELASKLCSLQEERTVISGNYSMAKDKISDIRQQVAEELIAEIGGRVRIRVNRNGDSLGYRQLLLEGLKGARLRNHDEILMGLLRLRPETLAAILHSRDVGELDAQTSLGKDRSQKIVDSFGASIDTFKLEIAPLDDQICIELNVATTEAPKFKDASQLSRGQKCTALLPLLMARRHSPLLVDQPEDNLDNHFIYETVVDSINRLKSKRQMIFVTHNANIPVLGEAELVVVMNSDGSRGFIEKVGSVDDCKKEIIDLLEGGEQAFELRRKRYSAV